MRKTYLSIYSSSCCGAGTPSVVIIVTLMFGCAFLDVHFAVYLTEEEICEYISHFSLPSHI